MKNDSDVEIVVEDVPDDKELDEITIEEASSQDPQQDRIVKTAIQLASYFKLENQDIEERIKLSASLSLLSIAASLTNQRDQIRMIHTAKTIAGV